MLKYLKRCLWRQPKATQQAERLAEYLRAFGWNAELEKCDGYKHIDIAITERRVNIEVDGGRHYRNPGQALADLARTYHSFRKGFVTLRVPNILAEDDFTLEETAAYINKLLRESEQEPHL